MKMCGDPSIPESKDFLQDVAEEQNGDHHVPE